MEEKKLKIAAPCPNCKIPLIIPIKESDLGKTKEGVCSKCRAKFKFTVPLSYASRFVSDPTIGDNEPEKTLILETIVNNKTEYQSFELTSDYYTIGRKNSGGPEHRPDVEVVTTDKLMSRIHAAIRKKGKSGFTIKDIGSKNGIFLNETRLGPNEVFLQDGDLIRFGETVFCVHIAEHSDDLQ